MKSSSKIQKEEVRNTDTWALFFKVLNLSIFLVMGLRNASLKKKKTQTGDSD